MSRGSDQDGWVGVWGFRDVVGPDGRVRTSHVRSPPVGGPSVRVIPCGMGGPGSPVPVVRMVAGYSLKLDPLHS